MRRSGKRANKPLDGHTIILTSQGATGGSSALANQVVSLTEGGNPFTGSQQGARSPIVAALDMTRFFDSGVFRTYDSYKVVSCITTVTWTTMPDRHPIGGEIMWVLDKDDRLPIAEALVANRQSLQTRVFNNNSLRHTIQWSPYLVEDSDTVNTGGAQLEYVQPRGRWLNCGLVNNHRFGTLRMIAQSFDLSGYTNDPTVEVRHRVTIELKGLKSVQAPATAFAAGTPQRASEERDLRRREYDVLPSLPDRR